MARTTLSEKGQVIIPAAIRARLGLRRGDRFEVDMNEQGLVLKPLPRSPLGALMGMLKGADGAEAFDEFLRERELDRQREEARATYFGAPAPVEDKPDAR